MAGKNTIDSEIENADEEIKSPAESQEAGLMDKIGSSEFYHGEKVIEDITLPGEKRNIKAETVRKEEIYEDKIKKQKAFIASLGRKKETGEKSDQERPEYVEEKSGPGRKIAFSLLGIIILGSLLGGGYWAWSRNKQKIVSDETSQQIIVPTEEPIQDSSDEKQNATENIQTEEIKLSEIAVKVLNVGAPAGSAGRVKDFLVAEGYTKSEASNGQEVNLAKSHVFFKEEKFKEKAQALSDLLLKKKKISAEIKAASSEEEKSADIVVELGKT